MLKVTVHHSEAAVRLQVEGKLTAPWATELENCWRVAESSAPGRLLIVDLTDVDYADAAGRYLLAWMQATGAELVAKSLPMQELVSELTGEPAGSFSPPRRRMAHRLVGWFLSALCGLPLIGAERPVLRLTLQRAVELSLTPEGNARIQIANESVRQAEARSAQTRADLLPNLDGYVSELNQTRNLAALGIGAGTLLPG